MFQHTGVKPPQIHAFGNIVISFADPVSISNYAELFAGAAVHFNGNQKRAAPIPVELSNLTEPVQIIVGGKLFSERTSLWYQQRTAISHVHLL